jgi:signal transduction histidine kinase
MHDGLGQTLSYLGLRTDRAVESLGAGRFEQVEEEFHEIRDTIGRATEEVRQSIASLHDTPPPRRPLQDLLSDIVSDFVADDNRRVELIAGLSAPLFLPPDQMEQVLRVTQEALSNAGRHAHAENITVYLEKQGDEVVVTVEDDGQGFNPEAPPTDGGDHFGLSIMRARATRIGGELKISSAPGDGTRVILTWSLN